MPRQHGSGQVEPVLAMVSRDAAVWDINEVLSHHMLLRTPVRGNRQQQVSAGGAAPKRGGQTVQKELHSFQEMLMDLKASRIPLPPGVTFARLKREVGVLVASTKEIQDDDVLLHNKIESLLQQRIREKGLDGLLSLQVAWRRNA